VSSALDQIFVHGKRWLLSWVAGAPNWVMQITSSLINIVALLAVFLTLFALISVLERKILAINGGILFFFAVGSATELAVFMAGWASNNKFSMLGAMRAIAQMFSYELPLIIAVLPVVMAVGSLVPDTIITAQGEYTLGVVPRWFVFTPWGAAAFILFFVSGLVESNRTPFDVPEGESEIVAGHMTEYSGFKYATFFMAEYLGMFAVSGLAVTLFLGGWHAPVRVLEFVPSYVWFFLKLSVLLFVYIWLRATLPRMRVDQMMNVAWKFMLPMAFTCVIATAVWHYAGRGLRGWLWSLFVIVVVYSAMSILLDTRRKFARRVYRFAE
jgi:NADH-quinone oxidoreductase subunit H